MLFYSLLLSPLLLGSFCHAGSRQKVLQFTPHNDQDLKAIKNLKKVLDFEPDYLIATRSLGKPGLILLQDGVSEQKTVEYVQQNGIENKVFDYNTNFVKVEELDFANLTATIENYYLSYSQQMELINHLQTTYSEFVKVENIGQSFEGRDIKKVQFGFAGKNKPILWVNAGIHAREWIGHSTVFYFMNQLTTNPKYVEILKKIDIIVSPNANPDGYEYSRTNDRLWRTNRRVMPTGCYGVDLNRNFPYLWENYTAKGDYCSKDNYDFDRDIYPGTGPASEPETQALTGAMEKVKDRIKGFIDLHSFGQQILYPWGYKTCTFPDDVDDLLDIAYHMKWAIKQERGTKYVVKNSAGLYPVFGATDDYAKSLGINYVYVMELSPEHVRFEAPETMIATVGNEITKALEVLAKQIVQQFTK